MHRRPSRAAAVLVGPQPASAPRALAERTGSQLAGSQRPQLWPAGSPRPGWRLTGSQPRSARFTGSLAAASLLAGSLLGGSLLASGANAASASAAKQAPAPAAVKAAAPAPAAAPAAHLTAFQTADRFAAVAYTWKARWYHRSHPSIGAREGALGSSTLDGILDRVTVAPATSAGTTTWTPEPGRDVRQRSLPGGVTAITVRLPVGETGGGTYSVTVAANVKRIAGVWTVLGATLPGASGPTRYCVDSPAATEHCSIYPAGSR